LIGAVDARHRWMMKILSYSGESVVTSDRMSDAVVDYAKALAAHHAADVIDVPVVDPTGDAMARLLIGPSSQLIVVPAHEPEVELRDDRAFAELRAKIEALRPARVLVGDDDSWPLYDVDLDLL
jgi:hypothetical protein